MPELVRAVPSLTQAVVLPGAEAQTATLVMAGAGRAPNVMLGDGRSSTPVFDPAP